MTHQTPTPEKPYIQGYVTEEQHQKLLNSNGDLMQKYYALPLEQRAGNTPPPGCPSLAKFSRDVRVKLKQEKFGALESLDNIMIAQTHVLDHVFDHMLQKSWLDTDTKIDTKRLHLALTAQRLCSTTISTFNKMK
ncbi:MAG: hypothetical protein IT558_00370 [Alphaproteobacteria bacterium]|nr:hypothetical protein [Alphaproteobacteria bacterium]